MLADVIAKLDAAGRLGWVSAPTPIQRLDSAARELGFGSLCVKRDDALPLGGGTKVRKLDFLLAQPAFVEAESWVGMGSIGSGQLVVLAQAAARMHKHLFAHCFLQPLSEGVLDNLAITASGPTTLLAHRSRTQLAARHPAVAAGARWRGHPVVPAGATCVAGTLGIVRGALELAQQVQAGELPAPDVVYACLGSGGTCVGLAVGLTLAGLSSRVVAVSAVEWLLATRRRLLAHAAEVCRELAKLGLHVSAQAAMLRLVIDRTQLGRGYAHATGASVAAQARLLREGIQLEPVYTGKAMAGLIASAAQLPRAHVLFWNTHRGAALQPQPGWQQRLPAALTRHLAQAGALHSY